MRVYKPTPRHRCWHIEFTDHRGRPRRCSSYQRDRGQAVDVGHFIEVLVGAAMNAQDEPPGRLHNWIDATKDELRALLIAWELIPEAWWTRRTSRRQELLAFDPPDAKPARGRRILPGCLIGQFSDALRGNGVQERTATEGVQNVVAVIEACGFKRIDDISSAAVSRHLLARRDTGRKISNRRSNALRQSCFQFGQWLRKTFRIVNPFDDEAVLPKLNDDLTRRRIRRGLEVDEARHLITITAKQPERHGLTGEQRSIVYYFAAAMGVRHGEIRKLRRCDFHLDQSLLVIPPKVSKHKREDTLEIPAELVAVLRKYFEASLFTPAARPFPMRDRTGAAMLRDDLQAAGIAEKDGAGRVIDFHAFRHTHGCWCFSVYGMNPKEVQERMRVSDLKLVMRYSESLRLKSNTWISKSPSLMKPEGDEKKCGA